MTAATLPLVEFLLERIADDEATVDLRFRGIGDPSRVLAECEAKRRIVSQIETDRLEDPRYTGYHLGWRHAQIRTLALLALPYADHPDYREEWRP